MFHIYGHNLADFYKKALYLHLYLHIAKRLSMKNIKRIISTLAVACAVSLSGFAQTARQVLDHTAAKIKNSGGIEAQFEGTQFKGTHEAGSAYGKIQMQGSKYKIQTSALTTWFDGKTQWTLMNGSDEVNVSKPSAAEQQQANPYTFINLYKQGYNLKLSNTSYHGRACHEVRMMAQSKNSALQLVIIVIEKSTQLPVSIRVKDNRGEWTRIRVSNVRTHRHWNDADFKFNTKSHPGIEVIDLR